MTSPLADSSGTPSGGPDEPLAGLRAAVGEAVAELAAAGEDAAIAEPTLERPRRAEFGDYSTNAALLLAPRLGAPPREVAERLGAAVAQRLGAALQSYDVAGPGFLNLFMSEDWCRRALAPALGPRFGAGGAVAAGGPERVLVEFVSANPTGPMHVGHARNAAYGDALARMLAFHGHSVAREFYINDAGSQIVKFGESVAALARGQEVPEDGYHGDYVGGLAAELPGAATLPVAEVGREAVAVMLDRTRASLAAFRVLDFDHWQHESALHEGHPSPVEHTFEVLAEQGRTYSADGALWLRTTEFGDDKDRVLVRSSGEHTYFASDTAYHQDKRERGFQRQIDVWGADHHGYVLRTKAAYEALGGDPDELELLIMQLVHLVRSGDRAQMSKRAGEFVTLDDLVEEIGVDAARWYLLARSHDTTVDLDLDLAREQSARTRSTTCSTPTPGSPRCSSAPAPGVSSGRSRQPVTAAWGSRCIPLSAPSCCCCSHSPAKSPSPSHGGRPIASRPTRWSWRRASRPSTATAGWWAQSPRPWSPSGSRCRWRR